MTISIDVGSESSHGGRINCGAHHFFSLLYIRYCIHPLLPSFQLQYVCRTHNWFTIFLMLAVEDIPGLQLLYLSRTHGVFVDSEQRQGKLLHVQ